MDEASKKEKVKDTKQWSIKWGSKGINTGDNITTGQLL